MSVGQKYLILFSYIGTKYAGLQRQTTRKEKTIKDNSIQACLEKAICSITPKPCGNVITCMSSRTDKFVHAFMNSCHLTLVHPQQGHIYCPHKLVDQANHYLNENACEISVLSAHLVHSDFYCREQIKSRSYYYRLAVIKPNVSTSHIHKLDTLLPINELNRCGIICHPYPLRLNFEAMEEAMKVFEGTHDFTCFMANSRTVDDYADDYCLRKIDCFQMSPLALNSIQNFTPLYKNIDIYNFSITSKSFLYKQIRRMMGCVVMSGLRRMKVESIKKMLDNPRDNAWNARYLTASPHGLYLSHLYYNPKDFYAPVRPSKAVARKEDIDYDTEVETKDEDEIEIGTKGRPT